MTLRPVVRPESRRNVHTSARSALHSVGKSFQFVPVATTAVGVGTVVTIRTGWSMLASARDPGVILPRAARTGARASSAPMLTGLARRADALAGGVPAGGGAPRGARVFLRRNEQIARREGLTPTRQLALLMIKGAPDGS